MEKFGQHHEMVSSKRKIILLDNVEFYPYISEEVLYKAILIDQDIQEKKDLRIIKHCFM